MKIISKDMQENFDLKYWKNILGKQIFIDSVYCKFKKIPGGQFKPFLLKNYISINTKSILEEYKLDLKGIFFTNSCKNLYI